MDSAVFYYWSTPTSAYTSNNDHLVWGIRKMQPEKNLAPTNKILKFIGEFLLHGPEAFMDNGSLEGHRKIWMTGSARGNSMVPFLWTVSKNLLVVSCMYKGC
jgi:hypothetical protein